MSTEIKEKNMIPCIKAPDGRNDVLRELHKSNNKNKRRPILQKFTQLNHIKLQKVRLYHDYNDGYIDRATFKDELTIIESIEKTIMNMHEQKLAEIEKKLDEIDKLAAQRDNIIELDFNSDDELSQKINHVENEGDSNDI